MKAQFEKKVDMIVDLQYGSTGKGLIAGYLAHTGDYDTVVTCNMPNAGHTYIDVSGQKMVHKVLPNGIVAPNLRAVMIGPGAIFDPIRLGMEIATAREFGYLPPSVQIMIHPNATILHERHAAHERATLNGISSTMQGSMAAMVEKMSRNPKEFSVLASDSEYSIVKEYVCTHKEWADALIQADKILAEGSQGHSLGINTEFYPYTTSRDCSPARFMSDMGIPHSMLNEVIGTARTYPIRVGNTKDGFSGPHYEDQEETTWEELGQKAETTTVTGRIRRVFTFSIEQVKDACFYCAPNKIFLNFCNYMQPHEVKALVELIEGSTGVHVAYTGWAADHEGVMQRADGRWAR